MDRRKKRIKSEGMGMRIECKNKRKHGREEERKTGVIKESVSERSQ